MTWETVIGLEVHVQLNTKSKIFCGCATRFGTPANTQTCPVCLALPGALPVLNAAALEKAVLAGLALGCEIQPFSKFDRKNYFYPDLPKAYQISQFDQPVALRGGVWIEDEAGNDKFINLTRIHIEEDAGKLMHAESGAINESYVNLNRAGTPLIEIVSEPQISSAEEAYRYLVNLKSVMKYIAVSDCNMEEGSLRCDANVSIRPAGDTRLGTRVEIKNLNSFKAVRAAILYEQERQAAALENKGALRQETRLWDAGTQKTTHMRFKEDEMDYRYFPEPDLVPVVLTDEYVSGLRATLPELPQAKRERYTRDLGVSPYDAGVLTAEKEMADYFEETLAIYRRLEKGGDAKKIVNWVTTEIAGKMNSHNLEIAGIRRLVSPENLAALVHLVGSGQISGKIGKTVFEKMIETGDKPETIMDREGLRQMNDTGAIEALIEQVIAANPETVAQYRAGKEKVFGFFVGEVMKKSRGQANPALLNGLIRKKLAAE